MGVVDTLHSVPITEMLAIHLYPESKSKSTWCRWWCAPHVREPFRKVINLWLNLPFCAL